jgi:hypothetical protein
VLEIKFGSLQDIDLQVAGCSVGLKLCTKQGVQDTSSDHMLGMYFSPPTFWHPHDDDGRRYLTLGLYSSMGHAWEQSPLYEITTTIEVGL